MDDELGQFLGHEEPKGNCPIDKLEEYFQPDDGTGLAVVEQIARITNKAVRGPKSKKDDKKLQELSDKHLKPSNTANLQASKIEM